MTTAPSAREATRITSEDELRALFGEPTPSSRRKVRTRLHPLDRQWLARSPFCLVATADADGNCDVSPKGDPPGFTLVLDDRTIALPERPGQPPTGRVPQHPVQPARRPAVPAAWPG